ncbi:MAG: lipopolysaccharide biosynthesis protein [Myxococcales bacterium]|nr:lipopolysaccharide biosynthesis protein [Myxococcales bacterium]
MNPQNAAPAEPSKAVPASGGLRRTLLKSTAHYAVAMFVSQGSGFLRVYVAAKVLGPAVFGVWLGLRLIIDYGAHLHLGVVFGMHRNVPLLRGQGDLAGADRAARTSFSFVLGMALLASACTAFAGAIWPRPSERGILFAIAAVLFVNLMRGHLQTAFKTENRFRELSTTSFIGAGVTVATLPLTYYAGLPGFVWGLFLQGLAEDAFLALRSGLPRLGIDRAALRHLLAVGLPAMAIVVASTLLTSIDRTVILERLDPVRLGHYGIAFIVATNFMISLAGIPHAVIYPRLTERYGRTGRREELAPLVLEPLSVMSVGFAALVAAGAIALPPLVRLFLPQFTPGIEAAQIALFGTYSYAVVGVLQACFYTLNWQKAYLAILLGAAGVSYLLARLFVGLWPGLPAVAAGCSLGLLLYMVAVVIGAFLIMGRTLREGLRALGRTLLPLGYSLACVLAFDAVAGRFLPPESIRRGLIGEGVLLVAMGPWLYLSLRKLAGR